MHGVQFLVLSRNLTKPSIFEGGWKDTVIVSTEETAMPGSANFSPKKRSRPASGLLRFDTSCAMRRRCSNCAMESSSRATAGPSPAIP